MVVTRAQMRPGEACWMGGAMQRMYRETVGKRARGEGGGKNERGEVGKSQYIYCISPESCQLMTSSRIEVEERRLLRNEICRCGPKTADFVPHR